MSEQTPKIDSVFMTALEIESPDQRAAYLDRACGDHTELRLEVEQMLAAQGNLGSFLEHPAADLDPTLIGDNNRNLAASIEAGLAPAFTKDSAVVLGYAGHSVLKSLARTMDIPHVALRESKGEVEDPIVRPKSCEIPFKNSDSRYQLQGEIARGGMGAILKGRDTDLGRDLAIKVLLDSHKDKPEVIQRFVEEAQIGGQLQHPGIAPVYELGQFADERPYFSMKLVKGETLAKLLAERENPAEERSRFIGIFEQICQTMAYAHSRGVIHRDLKPANIMVGAFGEVQVMDWGLAKVLSSGGISDEKKSRDTHLGRSVIQTCRSIGSDGPGPVGSIGSETQMGSVLGTPAYMPPEQALGEVDQLDERADVFGLGAILCEVLTGKPPYVSEDGTQVFRMASRGKLDDAFSRLDQCGADNELVTLAKGCLAAEPVNRPRDAGVLVDQVTGYLESVETRLRETEMQRAAEAARVVEERKRRRVTLALAASILIAVGLGGLGWYAVERQRSDRRAAAASRVNEDVQDARLHLGLADASSDDSEEGVATRIVELERAFESAVAAAELASAEDVEQSLRETVTGLQTMLEERITSTRGLAQRLAANRALVKRLAEIRLSATDRLERERDEEGRLLRRSFAYFDRAGVVSRYEVAFREAGLDLAVLSQDEAAERIRSSAIREDLIAALDDWLLILVQNSKEAAEGPTREKLLAILNAMDENAWRRKLRLGLAKGRTDILDSMVNDKEIDHQPPSLVAWYGAQLGRGNSLANARKVLRRAHQRNPKDFWLNYELAVHHWYPEQLRGEALGYARQAVAMRPESPGAWLLVANHALEMNHYEEAIFAARRAIELDPKLIHARIALGRCLVDQGNREEAIATFRSALELDPGFSSPRSWLCKELVKAGRLDEAEAEYRRAIRISADNAWNHEYLGDILRQQGRLEEALAEYRASIAIEPGVAYSHAARKSLGHVLLDLGRREEAIAALEGAHAAIESTHNFGFPRDYKSEFGEWLNQIRRGAFLGWLPSWSPKGDSLVCASTGVRQLVRVHLADGRRQVLVSDAHNPSWSSASDGLIAFTRDVDGEPHLFLCDENGENVRSLTRGGWTAGWTADGQTLFFTRRNELSGRPELCSIDTTKPEAESVKLLDVSWPYVAVSPDGTMVAMKENQRLVVREIRTGRDVATWATPGWIVVPGWSPDSRYVSFGSQKGEQGIWILSLERGEAFQAIENAGTKSRWSRDGRRIAYDIRSRTRLVEIVNVADLPWPKDWKRPVAN